MSAVDLLIVGSGPAGMSAAITARHHGLNVAVIDDQPAPGGQIWRAVERNTRSDAILGPTYVEGRAVAEAFRTSGARYLHGAQLWQIEPGFRAYLSRKRVAEMVDAKAIILATGAQERPIPFPGWTLPGVVTVGAAQILLKTAGQIPTGPTWIAGCGPLPLLYAIQLLRAGGELAGYLDTTPPGQWRAALKHLPKALRASADLLKGLSWMAKLTTSGVRVERGVTDLEALGDESLRQVRFETAKGSEIVDAGALLVHEGVVPNIHMAMSLDCAIEWDDAQQCFRPVVDPWGETSQSKLFVAGDGAGIGGANAALLRGELAALRAAAQLGRLSSEAAAHAARPVRKALARELAVRPFLDAMFKPRRAIFAPTDKTIVCRCEEISAGEIRSLAKIGLPGPNQIKAASRSGMGPCQGRQCGYTITRILSEVQQRAPADIGFYHVRPPLKPVTLAELASLQPLIDQ
ncbi:NAD(P)/FAD-dependent oxidoreductase [Sphingomonas crocodyli]|uniref:FAD-binding protein n=1 Tax=Sphingomonas crocodyli TaxID=1979270 RepID=A0A437M772_9SPHN|nr:NAD(P)/FAD-dependent oxidoreductase [Sphingomonas crocodyli]RVT93522.1 FAD-binding protein [Sphingomonas crocodyli]